ncbi:hypothetical protein BsWGS_09173 [Bradybaena similaris]
MALPYNCLRHLVRSQRNVKYILQREKSLQPGYSLGTRVFCSWRWTKEAYRRNARGFRAKRQPDGEPVIVMPKESGVPSLVKPIIFTAGVCSCSFVGAMIWNYEKMRKVYTDMKSGTKEDTDKNYLQKRFGIRDHLNSTWNKLTSGKKMIVGIIAANVGVFLLWRVPSFRPTMTRYFSSSAHHPLPSMILSTFSHISVVHLCLNMYVLWSFASVAVNFLGIEQFAAFYVSAGTVSSLASMVSSKLLRRPFSASVGASGAILALLGAVCVTYPTAQLSIALVGNIFPHSFSADTGMKSIIAFDTVGLALGWKFLDHAGHLGGMMFGLLYIKYGNKYIWGNRETVMRWWQNIRGKP